MLREPYNYFCFNPLYLFCKLGNYDILTRSLQFPSDKKGHFGGQKEHLIRKRDAGYHDGHHCESTGLEIFAFLLFLVYLLDFLRNILMNAMLNVMINDQTVTALQGKRTFLFNSKWQQEDCTCNIFLQMTQTCFHILTTFAPFWSW